MTDPKTKSTFASITPDANRVAVTPATFDMLDAFDRADSETAKAAAIAHQADKVASPALAKRAAADFAQIGWAALRLCGHPGAEIAEAMAVHLHAEANALRVPRQPSGRPLYEFARRFEDKARDHRLAVITPETVDLLDEAAVQLAIECRRVDYGDAAARAAEADFGFALIALDAFTVIGGSESFIARLMSFARSLRKEGDMIDDADYAAFDALSAAVMEADEIEAGRMVALGPDATDEDRKARASEINAMAMAAYEARRVAGAA